MCTGKLFVLILCYQEDYCIFLSVPSPLAQLSLLSQNTINVEVINMKLFNAQYNTLDMVEAIMQNSVSVKEIS